MTSLDDHTSHMAASAPDSPPHAADPNAHALKVLSQIRNAMVAQTTALHTTLAQVHPSCQMGARQLVQHLSLQSSDVQPLQQALAELGLAAIDRLNCTDTAHTPHMPKVVVTLTPATTTQPNWAHNWVGAGMDVACIDCAQDTPEVWQAMAADVRQAAIAHKRQVDILMVLAGTRLLTGDVQASLPLLKLKPGKDSMGRVFRPARLHLRPMDSAAPLNDADASVGVWGAWLSRLKTGTTLEFADARGAKRHMLVTECDSHGAMAECLQTAYLTNETVLFIRRTDKKKKHSTLVCKIEGQPGAVRLRVGDTFRLINANADPDGGLDAQDQHFEVPHVTSLVPEVIAQACVGHRIRIGSGRLCGVVVSKTTDHLDIEVTHAADQGERLHANMAIHLPDSRLRLPEFTEQDQLAMASVANLADQVCLAQVHEASTVQRVQDTLKGLGREHMGMVLKVCDRHSFENMPQNMLQAMASGPVSIWLDSSALALACGTERFAGVQDDVLRCAKAAQAPVMLSNQALADLSQSGQWPPSDVTSAGLSSQAHCLVLQPGPHVAQAIRTLVALRDSQSLATQSGRWRLMPPKTHSS